MPRIKLEFLNDQKQRLAGLLEMPENKPVAKYALFAHCFTCGKDIIAASRISKALADQGIAVLRFDFTGLGNSDGDFANTNFSSNVQDLLAAARKLEQDYQAPSLLIGHSLGGAAVLSAAPQLSSVKAVCTIGAPATASHVQHLFQDSVETVANEGEAKVRIGLREFNVKKQLLDDLDQYASPEHISGLKRALLVMHSPIDNIVSIDEAAKIYQAARHPKSYISLDQADHMLSNREDAEYVALTLAAWASRYLDIKRHEQEVSYGTAPDLDKGEVLVTELDKDFLRGLYTQHHQLLADEPISFGGTNLGPTPYNLLLMALGACTSMTIRMYAEHKGLELDDVDVKLIHERVDADECDDCGDRTGKVDRITRYIRVEGELTEQQRKSILRIANRCPVHKTLENEPLVVSQLVD